MRLFSTIFLAFLFIATIMNIDSIAQNEKKGLSIKIGETKLAENAGISVKLLEVVEDSRCPEGVDCIWAGRAIVKIALENKQSGLMEVKMEDTGEQNNVQFSGYRIHLVSLTPKPTAEGPPKAEDYVASFRFEKL